MVSVNTKKRIRVTLVFPSIPMNGVDRGMGTTTWDIKAPARDFEGHIHYFVEAGVLTLYRAKESEAFPPSEAFITFAHGQWMSVEYLPEPIERTITSTQDGAAPKRGN